MRPQHLIPVAALTLALAAAGCGSDGSSSSTSTPSTAAGTTASGTTAGGLKTTPEGAVVSVTKITKPAIGKEPTPTKLVIKDLKVGTGPVAKPGDALTVQYIGAVAKTGKVFDSSWSRGAAAFPLTLGQGQVIAGWDKGLVGMRVGGRRELIIPADQAYGAAGQPPTIPPNAALVFIVDLVSIG